MAGYIEKNECCRNYFNPTSCTVEVNPDNETESSSRSDELENLERWKWLIDKWDTMSFKERMSLFVPRLHYINLRDITRENFDEKLNSEIVEKSYEFCRNVDSIKFDPDRQGIPNLLIIYKPVYLDAIPDKVIMNKIINWGSKYGFIEYEYSLYDDFDEEFK